MIARPDPLKGEKIMFDTHAHLADSRFDVEGSIRGSDSQGYKASREYKKYNKFGREGLRLQSLF